MDENQVGGTVKSIAGRVQDAAGALTGDAGSQLRGKARQVAGQAQASYGDALETVRNVTADQPIVALAAVGFIGFVLGMLASRR